MTRDKMINNLMAMAKEMVKNYTWDKYCAIIDTCTDWNRDHEDEEIFVCDICEADGYEGNGIMVEDDYFLYE